MDRRAAIEKLRAALRTGDVSVGGWMQIPHPSVAEIMGNAGFDWVALDMEHGAIAVHQLPDLCRALELGNTLPLVRLARGHFTDCKASLDAGAGGVIVPMIETAEQLISVRDACRWPPAGRRGVGFSRANLFGKHFEVYSREAQAPLLVGMIEHHRAVKNIADIAAVEGLDALLVGPYDLSASINRTAQFDHPEFEDLMGRILAGARAAGVPCGLHVVTPSPDDFRRRVAAGFRFIAYGIDAVILHQGAVRPS